jgi:MFS family permease
MFCAGSTVAVLAVARLLQGLSAAVVWSAALALLVDTVGRQHIGQAMGYVSVSLTIAVLLGPVLGGVVYDRSGYYAVFAMAFALLGVDIFFRFVMIEKKVAARWLADVRDAGELEGEALQQQQQQQQQQFAALDPEKRASAAEGETGMAGDTNGRPLSTAAAGLPPATAAAAAAEQAPAQGRHLPPVLTLLKSRRMLSALWCSFIPASILASFESVRSNSSCLSLSSICFSPFSPFFPP